MYSVFSAGSLLHECYERRSLTGVGIGGDVGVLGVDFEVFKCSPTVMDSAFISVINFLFLENIHMETCLIA